MKRLSLVFALILVLALVVPASAQDPGSGQVNFTVQNLHATETATVVAQYVNSNGVAEKTVNKDILPRSSDGFPASASGLPDNWQGAAVVSSQVEIVAFGQAIWENSALATTEGRWKTAGAYNGFTAGANKLYLPSLASRDGNQFSRVSVQSAAGPSATDVTFSMKLYDRSGNLTHELTNQTVKEGAQKTFDLSTITQLGTDWLGAAVIESTSPLAAVATTHWKNYSAAYSAITGGGQKISLPSATRRVPNGSTWLQYTGVIVQNLDPSTAATATVKWYDRNGTLLHSFNDSIPANSAHGYNTRFPDTSDVPNATTFNSEIGNDWNGSVVIEANVDISAVANLQWAPAHAASPNSASAYTGFANGTAEVFVPATFRRGANAATQFTGLIVQNVGGSACTDFDVTWTPRGSGTAALTYKDTLAPNISHGYNTKQGTAGSDFPSTVGDVASALGDDFRGAVYINAPGCELVGIHNTVWPAWTDSTTYNAFGK